MFGWFDEIITIGVEHTKSYGNKGMLYRRGGKAREEESHRIDLEGEERMVGIAIDGGDASRCRSSS